MKYAYSIVHVSSGIENLIKRKARIKGLPNWSVFPVVP